MDLREKALLALLLRRRGAPVSDIAEVVGLNPNTVRRLLRLERLDAPDLAEFALGLTGLCEVERRVRPAGKPSRPRFSGERQRAEVIRLSSMVPVEMLKPHPKNEEYFSDPSSEEYEALKRSIQANGIRDPLKVLPDYTVVAGCLRLKIAKELGFTHVPVEIWDVSGQEAEYLLVADNEERRYCQDPIKKARRAEFLKRYWGVERGGDRRSKDQNGPLKTLGDVAKAVGEDRTSLKRLLKLNDLIPPLQKLVSQGNLSQIAAYSLAFLPPEEQEKLLEVLGEAGLSSLSVEEAKSLRQELDSERSRSKELEAKIKKLEEAMAKSDASSLEALKAEVNRLRSENEKLKAQKPKVVERVVEKVVSRPDPRQEEEIKKLREEVSRLKEKLSSGSGDLAELEEQIKQKRAELNMLDRWLKAKRCGQGLLVMLRKLFMPLEKAREEVAERLRSTDPTDLSGLLDMEMWEWVSLLSWYKTALEDFLKVKPAVVIDAYYREVSGEDDGRAPDVSLGADGEDDKRGS